MKGWLFTWILTISGSIYGLLRPVYGASIYVALSILKPPALWHWSVPIGRYTYYVAVSTLIGWARTGFGNWQHLRAMRPLLFCFGAYAAIQWISGFFCRWGLDPWIAYACQKLTNDMLMVLVAASLVNKFKELRVLTWALVAAAGYVAYEMNYSYYISNYNRIWYAEFAEIDNNGMAMIFAMALPMTLALGLYERNYFAKLGAWVWMPFLANAVFLANSRGGMLGMCFSAPFLLWLLPNKRRTYWILAGAIVFSLMLAGPSVQHRFMSIFVDEAERDASTQSRFTAWAAAWRCIQDYPWLGVGPRCWARVGRGYGAAGGLSVHNLFLQVGADTGVFSMAFMAGIYLLTMKTLLKNRTRREKDSPWYTYWCAGIVSGLGAGFMCSQFIGMERIEMPYFLALTGIGSVKVALAEDTSPAAMTTVQELDMLRRAGAAPAT